MLVKIAKGILTNFRGNGVIRTVHITRLSNAGLQFSPTRLQTKELCRSCLCIQQRFCSTSKDPLLHKFDVSHPVKGNLIYVGTLLKAVTAVKTFSLTTSFIALSFQPVLIKNLLDKPVTYALAVAIMTNLCVFITPAFLHWITRRYITSMYYNPEDSTFRATTLSFFLREKEHTFTANDVVIPRHGSLFSSILVKGKPLFFDPSMFLDKDAYIKLMKYDEPLEWEIEQDKKV